MPSHRQNEQEPPRSIICMYLWLQSVFGAAALVYACTLVLAVCGNAWVIASLLRTSRKAAASCASPSASASCANPSDRLRKYIWLLALLDLLVSGSLAFRLLVLVLPAQKFVDSTCQCAFALDQMAKLCSLTCLACISVERFITIRKPFNNRVRRVAIQLTPLLAFFTLCFCSVAVCWLSLYAVRATDDALNCTQRDWHDLGGAKAVAEWTLAIGFCAQLAVIGSNYARIVLHVRRKFWQRKARAVAHSFSVRQCSASENAGTARLVVKQHASPPPPAPLLVVAEPRYMRQMTTAIMRIAVFHLICWLPFCLLQTVPNAFHTLIPELDEAKMRSATAVRIVHTEWDENEWAAWTAFCVNWLTYANSAGNWVLYAALNRNLRSIIKVCSERRKRFTISHQNQQTGAMPGGSINLLKRSVRRTALHSLRLFYSLNSHRSSAASMEEGDAQSAATTSAILVLHQHNNSSCSPHTSLRAPSCSDSVRKHSTQSSSSNAAGQCDKATKLPVELGAFGWRDGRAHTYCAPANPHTAPATRVAHIRMAQKIIAAVCNSARTNGGQMDGQVANNKRRESAQERRELFAQTRSPLPPIVVSTSTDDA